MSYNDSPAITFSEIQSDMFKAYFAGLSSGAVMHSMVVMSSVGSPQIYIEVPADRKSKKSKLRLFLRKADYMAYARSIIATELVDAMMTRRLDLTATEAVTMAIKLDEGSLKRGEAGLEVVACVLIDNSLVELDVFWTNSIKQ